MLKFSESTKSPQQNACTVASMQIEPENLNVATESDVEQKILMPLLEGASLLAIPIGNIKTKSYLSPSSLDKGAGKSFGYYPDYSVWWHGLPLLLIEAKAPDVAVEVGFREAALYASQLNQRYPTGVNPCRFVIACNGRTLTYGYADSFPIRSVDVGDLLTGTAELDALREFCRSEIQEQYALEVRAHLRRSTVTMPYNLAGGAALLTGKLPVNTFAADLSPILRRYFASSSPEDSEEIVERAYVSSAEVTEYDRILESLLKDRLPSQRGALIQELEPDRRGEEHVERAILEFDKNRPKGGQLQIVQGAVGSGKSLFIQRYREVLQSAELRVRCYWSIVDFNSSPAVLVNAERWLCETFIESFEKQNPHIDLHSASTLRGVFSRNIQRKKAIYEEFTRHSTEVAAIEKAKDLARWQDDPDELARGIADYVLGMRKEVLVAVMDNVDKLDLDNQLKAFQLSLWFMQRTGAFVILQMRDETFERYKDRPPLDTFRTNLTFHISPPRFVDVVKRRLELSMEYLAEHAQEKQEYSIESGLRISYPKSELGEFLKKLYLDVFDRRRNVSRVLEALAGRNVRRALDMFVSIITSGHISPRSLTGTVLGGSSNVTERDIIKVLMRTEYRFFSEHSGFVFNIFSFDPEWENPDNLLIPEILYFLANNRKKRGQIGLEGYFSCRHISDKLQLFGYSDRDTICALNTLLQRELISSDKMNFASVGYDDSVRILSSGFIHLRVLASRLEYLYSILVSTPITEPDTARDIAASTNAERQRGDLPKLQKIAAVEQFYAYLVRQFRESPSPIDREQNSGAAYVLRKISDCLVHSKRPTDRHSQPDELD